LESGRERLLQHFHEALRADPVAAYRDWFRAQEELREKGDAGAARALADDLWEALPRLSFDSTESRARFHHNVAVFFGSPGAAADLARARACFSQTLDYFKEHGEDGWRARALHNLATAIANLGSRASELREAVALFSEALAWRTPEREIARGVTLHNLGLALRTLAELDPDHAPEHLAASAAALGEAVAIRERQGLRDGLAASTRELEQTLARLRDRQE
jgi:hypothetical protein